MWRVEEKQMIKGSKTLVFPSFPVPELLPALFSLVLCVKKRGKKSREMKRGEK